MQVAQPFHSIEGQNGLFRSFIIMSVDYFVLNSALQPLIALCLHKNLRIS